MSLESSVVPAIIQFDYRKCRMCVSVCVCLKGVRVLRGELREGESIVRVC